MDRFIVRKIRQLKRVQPDSSWLLSQKNFLLSEISREQKEKREPSLVLPLFNFNILKIFKPSFAIALGIIILATSFITIGVISASQNSLSGDFLYPLKTAFEKTQLTFTAGEINKTKLSIKFATQRMDEFTQLIDKSEDKEQIEKTVKNFTDQLLTVQESIDKLKEKNTEKAAEVAKLIKAKTPVYEEVLIKSNEKLGYILPSEKTSLEENINKAKEVNKALQETSNELIPEVESGSSFSAPAEATEDKEEIIVPGENIKELIESSSFENLKNEFIPQEETLEE